ncbi:MAG: FlgO family outer membrane protein [Anaeromyxobacteraceae bacterium]
MTTLRAPTPLSRTLLPPRFIAALAAALIAATPAAAAAADAAGEAQRIAASLANQLTVRPPRTPVQRVTVAPLREVGAAAAGRGKAFSEALEAALARGGKLEVRAWGALDQALREKALSGAQEGVPGVAPIPNVQGLVMGEAVAPADGGPVRLTVRLVLVPSGAVAASESGRLDASAAPSAASPTPSLQATAVPPPPPPAGPSPEARQRAVAESASVDVAIRRMADQLAAGFARLPGNARYRRLAVLQFTDAGPEAKKRELGTVVSAELATDLRRDHGLLLVEREKMGAVLAEAKLGAMGLTDARDASKVGALADAQALVVGQVSDAGGKFLLSARILSADTGETLAAASESVAAATLVALSSDSVVLRSKKDALFRSMVLPGFGQLYNRQPVKAAVFIGAEAALLGGAAFLHLAGASKEDAYKKYTPADGTDPTTAAAEARSLRDAAEARYGQRNWAIAGAAAVWLVNAADAYFSGVDGEKLTVAPTGTPAGGFGLALAGRF